MTDLFRTFREFRVEPGFREVADLLWLAGMWGSTTDGAQRERGKAGGLTAAEEELLEAHEESPCQVPVPREGPLDLVAPTPAARARAAGTVRVGGVRALRDSREAARALRPLKRRVPSRHAVVLDEEATVRRIAEAGVWAPVYVPAQGRMLDLALVVDSGPTMEPWEPMVRELRELLGVLGAFERIRIYRLDATGEAIRLFDADGVGERPLTAPVDPSGRTVVVVVGDCVGPGWYGPQMAGFFAAVGAAGPAAILQALPARTWRQTALGTAEPLRVSAGAQAVPNACLARRAVSPFFDPSGAIPVPVFDLSPPSLRAWARMVAGRPGETAAVALSEEDWRAPAAEPDDPIASARAFVAGGSPAATLAVLLSAVGPLSVPVMGVVQSALMPAAGPLAVAEILSSGLLCRAKAYSDDGTAWYEFRQGVREVLRAASSPLDALRVQTEVGRFLETRHPDRFSFSAAALASGGSPLAERFAQVSGLGGLSNPQPQAEHRSLSGAASKEVKRSRLDDADSRVEEDALRDLFVNDGEANRAASMFARLLGGRAETLRRVMPLKLFSKPGSLRTQAIVAQGLLYYTRGDYENAKRLAEDALARASDHTEKWIVSAARAVCALTGAFLDEDVDFEDEFEAAFADLEPNVASSDSTTLFWRGMIHAQCATAHWHRMRRGCPDLGEESHHPDLMKAQNHYSAAIHDLVEAGDYVFRPHAMNAVGHLLRLSGQRRESLRMYLATIKMATTTHNSRSQLGFVQGIAGWLGWLGEGTAYMELMTMVEYLYQEQESEMIPPIRAEYQLLWERFGGRPSIPNVSKLNSKKVTLTEAGSIAESHANRLLLTD